MREPKSRGGVNWPIQRRFSMRDTFRQLYALRQLTAIFGIASSFMLVLMIAFA
jgi:hypothetical protein